MPKATVNDHWRPGLDHRGIRWEVTVSFALGVYDVFASGIPGAIYLTLGVYITTRFGLLDLREVTSLGTIPLTIVAVVLSFFLGSATYRLGELLDHILPGAKGREVKEIVEPFLHRCPQAVGRPFVEADPYFLNSGIQLYNQGTALEIARLRSTGLMLRHSVPPLAAASAIALGEFFFHPQKWQAIIASLFLGLLAWGALIQGREFARWSRWKTLETAFWINDIDGALSHSTETSGAQEDSGPPPV